MAVFELSILLLLAGAALAAWARRVNVGAAAVCATVIVVRIAWVMGYAAVARWAGATHFSLRGALVVAWCGMRGIVTLAAALALPQLPNRAFILFTAFSVVLVTLVVQGMTVSPSMRLLQLRDDGSVEREVQLARVETSAASMRHAWHDWRRESRGRRRAMGGVGTARRGAGPKLSSAASCPTCARGE